MSSVFENAADADIVRFVNENPLAWIVPVANPSTAVLMPLLLESDTQGKPVSILGHIPKLCPATSTLADHPEVVCLFLGPNAYIQPEWVSQAGWAPTWNFVSLKVVGRFFADEALSEEAITKLVAHMEATKEPKWTVDTMGPRFEKLLQGVTGFRLAINTIAPRFKTGQDETATTLAEIYAALAGHSLQRWMNHDA